MDVNKPPKIKVLFKAILVIFRVIFSVAKLVLRTMFLVFATCFDIAGGNNTSGMSFTDHREMKRIRRQLEKLNKKLAQQ